MVAAICLTAGACLLWQRRKRRAPRQLTSASSKADKLDSDSEPRSSGGGLAESTSPLQQSWQALHSHNPLLSFTSFGLVTRSVPTSGLNRACPPAADCEVTGAGTSFLDSPLLPHRQIATHTAVPRGTLVLAVRSILLAQVT